MATIDASIEANRNAIDELMEVASATEASWTTPRAPGKWSPSQLVEHVARSLEQGANVIAGRPSTLPNLPFFIRPIARIFFNRIVKKGTFPKAKTNKAMDPVAGPETIAAARVRMEAAWGAFEQECRASAEDRETIESSAFGKVGLADYLRFMELHTRHHCKQLPQA